MMARNNIVVHHPVGASTCLRKQEVGKPNLNAAQPDAKAEGCVHDVAPRADKLRKGWAFRVGTWNIDSLKGRSGELVEPLTERQVDMACVQEIRWRGSGCRFFGAVGKRYKLFWMGSKAKTDGVGIFVAEKWVDSVVSIERHSERVLVLKMVLGDCLLNVFTVYAPHLSLPPCRGSNGSASSLDLRAGRGVGADNIIILGSLDRDWRGLWCGLEDRLCWSVECLTNSSAISS